MSQTYASAVKAYSEEIHLGVWPKPFEVWLEEMKQKGQYWEACSPAQTQINNL